MPVREARPREPKTATVERREASVPRHKRVHARLDALWDARRLASAWPAASCAGLTGASHAPERLSALRPPLDSGERSKGQKPRAQKRAAGTMECCHERSEETNPCRRSASRGGAAAACAGPARSPRAAPLMAHMRRQNLPAHAVAAARPINAARASRRRVGCIRS